MGVIHSFDLDLQVFIIILHHGCTEGIKIPVALQQQQQSRDIYTPDPVERHVQGHPQLHMQAQPQRHVPDALQCKYLHIRKLIYRCTPSTICRHSHTSHQKIPWTWCNGKTSSWTWPIPSQTNRGNMSLASFAQAFSKALPSYESVEVTHLCGFHICQVQFQKHCIQINLQMYHRSTQLQTSQSVQVSWYHLSWIIYHKRKSPYILTSNIIK